jgi:hypothetical protein
MCDHNAMSDAVQMSGSVLKYLTVLSDPSCCPLTRKSGGRGRRIALLTNLVFVVVFARERDGGQTDGWAEEKERKQKIVFVLVLPKESKSASASLSLFSVVPSAMEIETMHGSGRLLPCVFQL